MSKNTQNVTSDSLPQHIGEAGCPVVVDVWAEWCPPCRQLGPTLEQLAGEFKGRIVVLKINLDEDPHAGARLGIRSIPTLLYYRDGQEIDRQVGAPSPRDLKRTFEQLASGK